MGLLSPSRKMHHTAVQKDHGTILPTLAKDQCLVGIPGTDWSEFSFQAKAGAAMLV